ncbi:hypothetical protein KUTeg_010634 [Tegillarca granosa]|uniref:Uncharacterized protein n=1 Tax=Tegillarca granosa TaxID=220873 RepID=A0ABQ9F5G0_TEGGR|nr:hypothetical protein KUTeg_010634 [Tegillarca granosa]
MTQEANLAPRNFTFIHQLAPDCKLDNDLWTLGPSPINLTELDKELATYPDKLAAKEISEGFRFGFKLQYSGPRLSRSSPNLKSASEQHVHLKEKNEKEWDRFRELAPAAEADPETIPGEFFQLI